jgi:hypothetical protein
MAWVTLTADDVAGALTALKLNAAREAQLTETQVDPLTGIIADTIAMVRSAVASNSSNVLDTDTTLFPPELKRHAIWLCVRELMDRLGKATPLTDDQKARIKLADDAMQKVLDGSIRVSIPANPQTARDTQQNVGIQVAYGGTQTFGKGNLDGLI